MPVLENLQDSLRKVLCGEDSPEFRGRMGMGWAPSALSREHFVFQISACVPKQIYLTYCKHGLQYLCRVEHYVIQFEISMNQIFFIVIIWQVFH